MSGIYKSTIANTRTIAVIWPWSALGKCTIAEHSAVYARASPPSHPLRAASFRTCSPGRSPRWTRCCARSSA